MSLIFDRMFQMVVGTQGGLALCVVLRVGVSHPWVYGGSYSRSWSIRSHRLLPQSPVWMACAALVTVLGEEISVDQRPVTSGRSDLK